MDLRLVCNGKLFFSLAFLTSVGFISSELFVMLQVTRIVETDQTNRTAIVVAMEVETEMGPTVELEMGVVLMGNSVVWTVQEFVL